MRNAARNSPPAGRIVRPLAADEGVRRRRHRLERDEVLVRRGIDLGIADSPRGARPRSAFGRAEIAKAAPSPSRAKPSSKLRSASAPSNAATGRLSPVGKLPGVERQPPHRRQLEPPRRSGRIRRGPGTGGNRTTRGRDPPSRRSGSFRSSGLPVRGSRTSRADAGRETPLEASARFQSSLATIRSRDASATSQESRDQGTPWIGRPRSSKCSSGEPGSSTTSRPAAR